MENINFGTLKRISSDSRSSSVKSINSNECVENILKITHNLNEMLIDLSADECAMIIMSLQNWINRRHYNVCRKTPKIGDIFFADLGNVYDPEFAYPHPVLIIAKMGHYFLVVPVSSSPNNISTAYHPIDNITGNKYMRRVLKGDGFACDSALLVSNFRTISGGRLLAYKERLNDLQILDDIKDVIFNHIFSKKRIEMQKLKEQLLNKDK